MDHFDVLICGGGLAGLSFARQLRSGSETLRIGIIDRKADSEARTRYQVGESTVEGAAYYLSHKLKLRNHLDKSHLLKNGPRFFCGNPNRSIEQRIEIGSAGFPRIPSYQLDRSILAKELIDWNDANNIDFFPGYTIRKISIHQIGKHTVTASDTNGNKREFSAKWIIDASGRRRLLQKQFNLSRANGHRTAAAWLHINETIDINTLSSDSDWHARDPQGIRFRSTCFFVGKGYWVWLIVLASGKTSIGIVLDKNEHPDIVLRTPTDFRAWLNKNEPTLHEHVHNRPHQNFHSLPELSYSARRVFSPELWACVGDAGVFLDPLYSPGIDMIGLSNSMVVDLILRDQTGDCDAHRIETYNDFYLRTARTYLKTFRANYPVFDNPYVFMAKLYWDTLLYWVYFAPLQIYDIYRVAQTGEDCFNRFARLESRMQHLFRRWARVCNRLAPNYTAYPPPGSILIELHSELNHARTAEDALQYIKDSLEIVEATAGVIFMRAATELYPAHIEQLKARGGI
ncbi:MAG: tryptophan 7-halogenase, partial [Leptospiraceae bacterium]|nr:tryptophan 7-halogenase [Leptospiraceae bacterium]